MSAAPLAQTVLDRPLATAELLAVDCETNGLGGDGCELTEVGTALVGGGEVHDTWASLVSVQRPLRRGIQRFTGISQAMVDSAPAPATVLPELARLLEGRVMVAHNAPFDRRVLRQAFEREGLDWPEPPLLCTVALARRCAPLVRRRGLGPLAESLGIEVDGAHRALPDAVTCARVLCALFGRLCASAPTVGDAVQVLGPRRRRSRRGAASSANGAAPLSRRAEAPLTGRAGVPRSGRGRRAIPTSARPDLSALPSDPGVYIFRDESGRPLYVGKSVSLRTRARAHFCAPAGWTERAEVVDYRATNSELGALVLENRLIKLMSPPGNTALKRTDRWVYIRARLDVEYPVLEVSAEPAAGRAVSIGPLRGRARAQELADHLTSLFRLRHCGRRLARRDHPSIYGQMGRCCSPCLGDLDPNAYRRQLDAALALFDAPGRAADRILGRLDRDLGAASAARHYERAAALLRRRERLAALLGRLSGVLGAVQSRPRLVLAPHPTKERFDALWIVAGRVADWAPLECAGDLEARTAAVPSAPPQRELAPEEVDEVRIVSAWLAEHAPAQLALEPAPGAAALAALVARARRPPQAAETSATSTRPAAPRASASSEVTSVASRPSLSAT